MRVLMTVLLGLLLAGPSLPLDAQTRRPPPKKAAPTKKAPAPQGLTTVAATVQCPSELGAGVTTQRVFCDVLTAADPKDGIIVTVPPHRGTARLMFDLHNRHTYSEDLARAGRAFRRYTASIGVLTLDNTLVRRAVIESEFRGERDLFDRIGGGAGPGGVKAVAPSGVESIAMDLPAGVTEVSILGEKLTVIRPDGTDLYSSPGRPVATISNVRLEYRPGPPPPKRP
ncbi:MAG: hypothetical protein Q8L86_10595 [Vicinamibacterales bacterium]|nr:hypothetical protein [Vicinamibacterales bacterium]